MPLSERHSFFYIFPNMISGIENAIYNRTSLLVGQEVMKAFSEAKVIIFGVGGVGSWCAEGLVRSGVKHLTIVDSDRVCITNVNRQLMATPSTVGQVKVETLKARLLEINPKAEINAVQKIYSSETSDEFGLEEYDYIIIDTSPIGLVPDAYAIIEQSDLCLFVIRCMQTNKAFCKQTLEQMSEVVDTPEKVQLVLSDIPTEGRHSYGSGYGYGYGGYGGYGYGHLGYGGYGGYGYGYGGDNGKSKRYGKLYGKLYGKFIKDEKAYRSYHYYHHDEDDEEAKQQTTD